MVVVMVNLAVLVDILTDNRNRTAADVRSAFAKFGGAMGENGSVSFMFSRVGSIVYPANAGDADAMLESLVRLAALDPATRVIPGHGAETTIEAESAWIQQARQRGTLTGARP